MHRSVGDALLTLEFLLVFDYYVKVHNRINHHIYFSYTLEIQTETRVAESGGDSDVLSCTSGVPILTPHFVTSIPFDMMIDVRSCMKRLINNFKVTNSTEISSSQ